MARFAGLLKQELERSTFGLLLKAEVDRAQYHKNTDQIVDHYSQAIQDALRQAYSGETIRNAMRAAYQATKPEPIEKCALKDRVKRPDGVLGTVTGVWQNPPDLESDQSERMNVLWDDHLWAYGLKESDFKHVAIKEAAPDPRVAQILSSIQGAINTTALEQVLHELYGDAAIQGSHVAATAAGGQMVVGVTKISADFPADYWDHWQPGYGAAAAKIRGNGLGDLLSRSGVTIQGLTDSATERLGNVLADSLQAGDSYETAAQKIADGICSPARASTIADTEYARAMSAASMSTYRANGVEQVGWLAEDDACPACLDNAGASPIGIDDSWPAGDVPVHPMCRCSVEPVIDTGE